MGGGVANSGTGTGVDYGPTRLPPEQPPPGGWPTEGPTRLPPIQPPPGGWGATALDGERANPITATLGSAPQPGAPGSLENSLYSSVTNQINGPTTVDRNDPAYKQQVDAYNANPHRAGSGAE
jgi:hypothetical protein